MKITKMYTDRNRSSIRIDGSGFGAAKGDDCRVTAQADGGNAIELNVSEWSSSQINVSKSTRNYTLQPGTRYSYVVHRGNNESNTFAYTFQ